MSKTTCEFCVNNNDITKCLNSNCFLHDTFITKHLLTRLYEITNIIKICKGFNPTPFDSEFNEILDLTSLNSECDLPELESICNHELIDLRNHNLQNGELCIKCGFYRSSNFDDITFEEDTDRYGDLMLLEDFIQSCEHGAFINSDGFGRYSLEFMESSKEVYPSQILKSPDRRFTHVIWYNK